MAGYGHVPYMTASVPVPSSMRALTQIRNTCVRAYYIVQPDLSSPGVTFIKYMSHEPVRHDHHTCDNNGWLGGVVVRASDL